MKHLLIFAVSMAAVSCASDDEISTVSSSSPSSSDAVSCGDISIDRADVNQDGVVDILDLTATTCHFGKDLSGLQYGYQALLYLRGGVGQPSGETTTNELFGAGFSPTVDWDNAPPGTLEKVEEDRQKHEKRVVPHDANGMPVAGVLAAWPSGDGQNIHSLSSGRTSAIIDELFFIKGAENKNIRKLAFFMGETLVDDADLEVSALADTTIALRAEPAAYATDNGIWIRRTYYELTSSIGDPEGEDFKFTNELREKGVEFITVDSDGMVLNYFNTKSPSGTWGNGMRGGAQPYFRADVYQFTCTVGQRVFARIKGDINIYQGACEESQHGH